jgi:hypothetical protein
LCGIGESRLESVSPVRAIPCSPHLRNTVHHFQFLLTALCYVSEVPVAGVALLTIVWARPQKQRKCTLSEGWLQLTWNQHRSRLKAVTTPGSTYRWEW